MGITRPRRPRPKHLAAKLAEIRRNLGLSQAELIDRLHYTESDLTQGMVSNFELGRREPPLPLLLAYARLAGVSTDALIDDHVAPEEATQKSR
jgi:transcriptional regulator with XRE-family HTH domain